jgi:hypothetical protein
MTEYIEKRSVPRPIQLCPIAHPVAFVGRELAGLAIATYSFSMATHLHAMTTHPFATDTQATYFQKY